MNLIEGLTNFNLTKQEATLYVLLLKAGQLTGYEAAKQTGISRSNAYNALAAASVGLELGESLEQIQEGIESAKTIAGRTNFIHTKGMIVIDDCYNANPVSMEAALDILSHSKGRSIAVLGDMGELGTNEVALHKGVGKIVAQKGIDVLFCAGNLAKEYAKEAQHATDVHYFENREDMTEALVSFVREGDSILVKASHFMEFPKVVEALTK